MKEQSSSGHTCFKSNASNEGEKSDMTEETSKCKNSGKVMDKIGRKVAQKNKSTRVFREDCSLVFNSYV